MRNDSHAKGCSAFRLSLACSFIMKSSDPVLNLRRWKLITSVLRSQLAFDCVNKEPKAD
jgi:hypothetical protein